MDSINSLASMPAHAEMIASIASKQCTLAISESDLGELLRRLSDVVLRGLSGDVVELGCWRGGTSVAFGCLLKALGSSRKVHACDSFEGLPAPTDKDGDCFGDQGAFADTSPALIVDAFVAQGLPAPVIHRGWFRDILDYPPEICFAFLDGDLYDSVSDSLAVVWPRLVVGGVVAIHDYANPGFPGAPRACRDFFQNKLCVCETFGDLGIFVKKDG